MIRVKCSVSKGLRDSESTVAVDAKDGSRQFLRVQSEFVSRVGSEYYLPVGLVRLDERQKQALIEFPHESDSGQYRVWVGQDCLQGLQEMEP